MRASTVAIAEIKIGKRHRRELATLAQLACRFIRGELRPPIQRVSTLASFDLAIFGLDPVAMLCAERPDGSLLCLQP